MFTLFNAIIARHFPGAVLLDFERLHGGVSAKVYALEYQDRHGRVSKIVLRQHQYASWKHQHEHVA